MKDKNNTTTANILPLSDEELTQLHCLVVSKMLELRQQVNNHQIPQQQGSREIHALSSISSKMAKYRTEIPTTERN